MLAQATHTLERRWAHTYTVAESLSERLAYVMMLLSSARWKQSCRSSDSNRTSRQWGERGPSGGISGVLK